MSARPGVRGGGRYFRCMGTLWRHRKANKAGDAALGLLVRCWSYCADQGTSIIEQAGMAMLMAGDKNGPRKLKALLDAGLLDLTPAGYTPHDAEQHNPILRAANEPAEKSPGLANVTPIVTGNVTWNVTGNVSSGLEQNQDVSNHASRPMSPCPMSPREEEEKKKKMESASAEAPATPTLSLVEPPAPKPKRERKPRAAKPVSADLEAFRAAFSEATSEAKLLPIQLGKDLELALLDKTQKLALADGTTLAIATRKLALGSFNLHSLTTSRRPGYLVTWALKDWQPTAAKQDVTRGFLRSPEASVYRKWAPGEFDKHIDELFQDQPAQKAAGAL